MRLVEIQGFSPDSGSAVINILNLLTGSADRPCTTPRLRLT